MKLADLLKKTSCLSIEYRGDTVEVEYLTEKITPAFQEELKNLAEEVTLQETNAPDAKLLSGLLVSWDITDGTKKWPPTFENLLQLSYPFLATLARAILNDLVNPTNASTNRSQTGSPQTEQ